MVEIICNLRKTKEEFVRYCYMLTKRLIGTEFRKLKSYDLIIRWISTKDSDKMVAAVRDWADDKRYEFLLNQVDRKGLTIFLNSRYSKDMGNWSKKKTTDLLRHELMHVSMKKGNSDPAFKKELEKRKVSATHTMLSDMPIEERFKDFTVELKKVKKSINKKGR